MAYHLIGIDLGGTKLSAGLTDTDGRVIRLEREPVAAPWEVGRTVDAMAAIARRVARDIPPASVLGVGVAVFGVVDRQTGTVKASPALGWHGVRLRDELRARLPWDVFIGNDNGLATVAEWQQGAGKGAESLLGVYVGTGVGAGLVLDGRLYEGRHFAAGQLGRVFLPVGGTNGFGQRRGRLEEIASGPALCHRVMRALLAGEPSEIQMTAGGGVTAEEIGRAESAGDSLALRAIAESADALGLVIANAVTLLDPDRVVLGGGVVRAIPTLPARVREVVRRHGDWGMECPHEVAPAEFGREAPIIGAVLLARTAGRLATESGALGGTRGGGETGR